MTSLTFLLFFFQLVLAVMAVLNVVLGFASAIADRSLETAKYRWLWAMVEGGLSLICGLAALGILK